MIPKTSDLCDACADAQVCELAFLGFGGRRSFAGSIRTARLEGVGLLRELVNRPGDDQVLVIDATGLPWHAVFGDVMAGLAVRNRWAGVVVNGRIRDGAEIDAMDLGVKALGTVPRRASTGSAGELDVPVRFGGVTFTPGLRLVADADGVIVLPPGLTERDIEIAAVVAQTAAYAASRG